MISTNVNEIVFDPFGGGGSTYEAAQLNNRFLLGCEICTSDAIANRLKDHFPLGYGKAPDAALLKVFESGAFYNKRVAP